MFKKAAFIILFIFVEQLSFAQSIEESKSKGIVYGFNFGINSTILDYESSNSISEKEKLGFRLGILAEQKIAKQFFVSVNGELSFNNNSLKINDGSAYDVMPASIEAMAHFGYKITSGNLNPYFILGPNFKLPLANKEANSDIFKTKSDFAIDFGVGLERTFTYFFFAPELRYSCGLMDINKNPALKNVYLHNISLVFNFKG